MPADRDFELIWYPAPRTEPTAAVFTEQHHGDTYAMLMLAPPTVLNDHTPHIPRDLTFVIDTSGSMAGPSIEQAKAAVAAALTKLDHARSIQHHSVQRSGPITLP